MSIRARQFVIAALLWLGFAAAAQAIEPFIIADIRVEGLERLEEGTVFNYLPLKVGDELNDEEARLSIKALFATGFFRNVKIERDAEVLVVIVEERPSIAEIKVEGNKQLATADIEQSLEALGLVEGRIFNSATLDGVKQELKNTYLALGRYSAEVETEVEELERNRVAISVSIDEGSIATIKKINIIGAEQISSRKLKKQMQLRDKRRWFSKRNQYSKQKLEADIENIRSYYLNRGYSNFEVISTSVDISPNKQSIFISISVFEGDRYVFGEARIEGGEQTEVYGVEELIEIEPGKTFSRNLISQTRVAITEHFADQGYAFVEVRPVLETDEQTKSVAVVFSISPGRKSYVRRVTISGNTLTRDEVIRRELRQLEGGWFSSGAVRRSRDRLQRLGFFNSVMIETPTVAGTDDQVDVNVLVNERETGSIQVSAGYSDSDGALFGGSYQQRNLLGSGRELEVEANTSDAARTVSVSYSNPYYTEDGVSRSIDFSTRRTDASDVGTAEYVLDAQRAGLKYSIPIAETNSVRFSVNAENLNMKTSSATPSEIRETFDELGDCEVVATANCEEKLANLVFEFGASKDSRDAHFFPTKGANSSVSLELSAPGGDYEYYKANLQTSYYHPLTDNLTWKGFAGVGFGGGFGDSERLPFFKHYFAGGSNSARTYDGRSLGPEDCGTSPQPLGGDRRLLLNTELLFPPFGQSNNNDKRFGLFIDGAMVFGYSRRDEDGECPEGADYTPAKREKFDFGTMRYSAGVFFNWLSPVGPFSLSYGSPLNKEEDDDVERFQISFGASFR